MKKTKEKINEKKLGKLKKKIILKNKFEKKTKKKGKSKKKKKNRKESLWITVVIHIEMCAGNRQGLVYVLICG